MNIKRFLHSNRAKVLGLFLLFAFLVFLGGILFTCGLGFRKRPLPLRLFYMGTAVLWVIMSIRWVCIRVKFPKIWAGMKEEFYRQEDTYERDLHKRYTDLQDHYPMALAEYESHCWHQKPRPTPLDIMEQAMAISANDWTQREEQAKHKMAEKYGKKEA